MCYWGNREKLTTCSYLSQCHTNSDLQRGPLSVQCLGLSARHAHIPATAEVPALQTHKCTCACTHTVLSIRVWNRFSQFQSASYIEIGYTSHRPFSWQIKHLHKIGISDTHAWNSGKSPDYDSFPLNIVLLLTLMPSQQHERLTPGVISEQQCCN